MAVKMKRTYNILIDIIIVIFFSIVMTLQINLTSNINTGMPGDAVRQLQVQLDQQTLQH